jgi:dihydrofolate reductase
VAKLTYSAIASLDGYVSDEQGKFDWAMPDEEVHAFVNELERPIGTYLYGRRMYETMTYWERAPDLAEEPRVVQDFAALWQSAEKVVYSRTLETPETARTRIEPEWDSSAVHLLKEDAEHDLAVGGAELAGHAIRAGLVDEYQCLLVPVLVGGGKRALPDGVHAELRLVDERRLANGTMFLRYRMSAES